MKTANAMQLKALIKKKSKELNVAPQLVLQNYMLERLLERISRSEYSDKFIIKGGFLLSSIVGLSTRATMDLDTTIKGFTLTKENLSNIITDICDVEAEDDVKFELLKLDDIRETDDYPGLRVFLDANYPPMKVPLTIDVTTGDKITPKEIDYCYTSMFDDTKINILAYTIETVLAEKLETVLARGIANTRPRDYYDIYVLLRTKEKDIDYPVLKQALLATCNKRGSAYIIDSYETIIETLNKSAELQGQWKKYQKAYLYAKDIEYTDTCKAVYEIMNRLNNL
ncbi:nucleotidyl transferase AbiEii/AbiGii toxin family protein [Oribacterium sp. WCC10]|uniref:nucleotidyl transferase AbiEii/AbiGii toxin family protein n=1 Tax=Oribacterium sp. WCC10 TaxID=1855343 RepID=UPI0008E26220|nr:nucleotidyl transferase AbiEii/AbiGii toxin family protein [Oribacterium sp. WCC10]SFG58837.1 Predicted nucleotidyltransferase component of viral defense system [Oribacterium sp. WCC10]